jgi:anti-sigma factor RsiW
MSTLRCQDVRESLRALHAGRLSPAESQAVREHLASCEACTEADAADLALTALLEQKLPRPLAPEGLQRRLAALALGSPSAHASAAPEQPASVVREEPPVASTPLPARRMRSPRAWAVAGSFAAAALALLVVLRPGPTEQNPLLREVVNDHLRVLYAQQPVEIESGGIHQVKPWFEGRLDFAPRVLVEDDEAFLLRGGAVSYVLDRKAAAFVYKRRQHTISLFVFRADGLPWPHAAERALGPVEAQVDTQRGFNVLLFRQQDLAYALVSDLNLRELSELGEKLVQR